MTVNKRLISRSCFNRTFMELKEKSIKIIFVTNFGFNRTFMELKERFGMLILPMVGFQSHLYGIERLFIPIIFGFVVCFNRTFMELKVCLLCHLIIVVMFQSHLYGIESSNVISGRSRL